MKAEYCERIIPNCCSSPEYEFCGWEISFDPAVGKNMRSVFDKNALRLSGEFRLAIVWPQEGHAIIVTDYPQSKQERSDALEYIKSLVEQVEA